VFQPCVVLAIDWSDLPSNKGNSKLDRLNILKLHEKKSKHPSGAIYTLYWDLPHREE